MPEDALPRPWVLWLPSWTWPGLVMLWAMWLASRLMAWHVQLNRGVGTQAQENASARTRVTSYPLLGKWLPTLTAEPQARPVTDSRALLPIY